MLRRSFLRGLAVGLLAAWSGARASRAGATFRHGVASGDPQSDAVIIWTRVSDIPARRVRVDWLVAADPEFRNVLRRGRLATNRDRDYTVKVDVRGLPAGETLYYRFSVDGVSSPVGRTRTLPVGPLEQAVFAVVSCSNYPAGYFHAYREIAKRDDVAAVLHLGDYLYEYGVGEYATEPAAALGRVPDPAHEILTLADYRRRHAQYKSDPDSQAMLGRHPFIAVWDDHEIANDAWRDGAQNHDEDEGAWRRRRDAAVRAYYEWMPIRGRARGGATRTFRTFRFGDLLSLSMLDTRLYGRDRQADAGRKTTRASIAAALADHRRRLLGRRQERWLRATLKRASGTTWQLIGQQVMMSAVRAPDLEPLVDPDGPTPLPREMLDHSIAMSKDNPPLLLDTWDGYPAARADLLADLQRFAKNPVVLSGDLHTSLAGDLVADGGTEPVAVEFMTTSVSSPGFADYLPEREPNAVRDATLALNPALRYMETARRGWLCMTISNEACTGEWHLLDTVHAKPYTSRVDRRLTVHAGRVSAGLRNA